MASMQGVKQIMDVLAHGDVFCTYPDRLPGTGRVAATSPRN